MGQTTEKVAILGAGIMGSCAALCLAERGIRSVLFDKNSEPMAGASRWNEGKIHLGYLYAASQKLDTARRVIPGGLQFRPIVERILGKSIETWISRADETYLFHKDSVISLDAARRYFAAVNELLAAGKDRENYLEPLSGISLTELGHSELAEICNPELIVGGLRAPERSVNTVAIADALAGRLLEEPLIELQLDHRVLDVEQIRRRGRDAWAVKTGKGGYEPFRSVINSLWEGRPLIDRSVLGSTDRQTHHRFRVSAFIKTRTELDHASVVIAAGPFGDVKNYDKRNFYLSWYPAGLLAEGSQVAPPDEPGISSSEAARIIDEISEGLTPILPGVRSILDHADKTQVAGGWVYAQGSGRLDQVTSSLHQRSRLGITHHNGYFSVDTGKYSVAPTLAEALSDAILE